VITKRSDKRAIKVNVKRGFSKTNNFLGEKTPDNKLFAVNVSVCA